MGVIAIGKVHALFSTSTIGSEKLYYPSREQALQKQNNLTPHTMALLRLDLCIVSATIKQTKDCFTGPCSKTLNKSLAFFFGPAKGQVLLGLTSQLIVLIINILDASDIRTRNSK